MIRGSSTRTEPAAELRGLLKILPPCSACCWLSASKALRDISTSPRTSKFCGKPNFFSSFSSMLSGIERIVFTLGVTSSPVVPSPRVTPRAR